MLITEIEPGDYRMNCDPEETGQLTELLVALNNPEITNIDDLLCYLISQAVNWRYELITPDTDFGISLSHAEKIVFEAFKENKTNAFYKSFPK